MHSRQAPRPMITKIPKLSAKTFARRRSAANISLEQLTMLTDIGRQRISRIEKGHEASLCRDPDSKQFFVPRSLTMALLCAEQDLTF